MMPNEEETKYIIDLKRDMTETERNRVIENFALKAAPTWFSWIGWLLAISGLNYLFKQSKSILIAIVYTISMYLLWEYFLAFFYRLEFRGLPFIKNKKRAMLASIVLSTFLAWGFWQMAQRIVWIVTTNKP
jgi:hypothetical protein